MDREIGVRTKAIIVALLVCLSAPQLGCASVAKQGSGSTERAATAVKNKDKKKPSEEKAAQTSGTKNEEKKESDDKDQKSDDSKKEDNKSSDSSKSDNKGDSSQSKQNPAIRRVPAATIPLPTAAARRSGLPSRATGRQITARSGCRMWFIRAMNVGSAVHATQHLDLQPKWTLTLTLLLAMRSILTAVLQSMIRIPPLRTKDIMNSRLRDNIGLSTSPVTGSNVHRSSPLTFGKCLFAGGRFGRLF